MVQQFAFVPFNFYFFAEMTAQFPHNQSLQFRVRFYCNFLTSIPSFLHFYWNIFFTWRLTFIIRPVYSYWLRLCLFFNFLHSYFQSVSLSVLNFDLCRSSIFHCVCLTLSFHFRKQIELLGVNSVYIANIKNIHFSFFTWKISQIYKFFIKVLFVSHFWWNWEVKKVFLII